MNGAFDSGALLVLWVFFPALIGCILLLLPKKAHTLQLNTLFTGFLPNLVLAVLLYGKEAALHKEWLGFGIDFSLRLYPLSGLLLLAAAAVGLIVAVYTASCMHKKAEAKRHYAFMLFTLAMVNGALLANNLFLMLFFWQGILATLFGMLYLGGKDGYKTAVKALILMGAGDLCLMFGIGITEHASHTLAMDQISGLPIHGLEAAGFAFLTIGALTRLGAMPLNTWEKDASKNTSVMAFMPALMQKILGVYLLIRIFSDFFVNEPNVATNHLALVIGAVTALFGALMALVQTDFKRTLSHLGTSQAGFILLGIGSMNPLGYAGSLYLTLIFIVSQTLLHFVAGAVERQTGVTELKSLGGLFKKMPFTAACFTLAAAIAAGLPLPGVFFARHHINSAALINGGQVYYIVLLVTAFLAAMALIRLGHAVFFTKREKGATVKEAPLSMLIPMGALLLLLLAPVFFHKALLVNHIAPAITAFMPLVEWTLYTDWAFIALSTLIIALAVLAHVFAVRREKSAAGAASFLRGAPVFKTAFDMADKGHFDVYELCGRGLKAFARVSLAINDGINSFYDKAVPRGIEVLSGLVGRAHNGDQARYVIWSLVGMALVAVLFILFL